MSLLYTMPASVHLATKPGNGRPRGGRRENTAGRVTEDVCGALGARPALPGTGLPCTWGEWAGSSGAPRGGEAARPGRAWGVPWRWEGSWQVDRPLRFIHTPQGSIEESRKVR